MFRLTKAAFLQTLQPTTGGWPDQPPREDEHEDGSRIDDPDSGIEIPDDIDEEGMSAAFFVPLWSWS
jgi:hypothetical protein